MKITLGVDGSASSESASMIQEANLAWLIHRAVNGPSATSLQGTLAWASRNGAELLGLTDLGELAVGRAADLMVYDLSHYRYEGLHERAMAPLLAAEPVSIKAGLVNGKLVVADGEPVNFDSERLVAELRQEMQALLKRAS